MPVENYRSESERIERRKNKAIFRNYLTTNIIESGSDSTKQDSARIPILLGSIETPCYVEAATVVPPIVTTDLLIHFEANNTTSYPGSGSTWVNIGTGGTTYNATLLGESGYPTFDNGSIKSFQFTYNRLDTSDAFFNYNYMHFLRPDAISDDFTWCAWIKTTNVGYGLNHFELMYIVSTEQVNVNNDFGFGIDRDGKLTYGDGEEHNVDITIRTSRAVNTGVWTFVAVTRQKSTGSVVLYINGVADTAGTCNVGNTLSSAEYVLIGAESDSIGYTFGGNMGAVLGNTSVLTGAQILQNFNAQRAIYGV
jgi:hypothetical protein